MTTAFLFDLDGTLMDSVYQHVLAWREALEKIGLELSVWRIHRRIGMSGGLFLDALLRETGRRFGAEEAAVVKASHAAAFARLVGTVRPLPGARELLTYLTTANVPWAIATSGWIDSARPMLERLGVPAGGTSSHFHFGLSSSASHITCNASTSGDNVIANCSAFSVAAFHWSTGTITIGGVRFRAFRTVALVSATSFPARS